jgi:hypothetical protein
MDFSSDAAFNDEQRSAYEAYAANPTHEAWDILSQVFVGSVTVSDAVKVCDPTFPDAYPLPIENIDADFLQWPKLPDVALVLTAMRKALADR